MSLDLDAYFERIGYHGARQPTLATLRALHELHPRAIAFENLDPWLGRRVELDPQALEHKLVQRGRGGYCYEHNGLFLEVLVALEFSVRGLAARVRWTLPADADTPRNHMLLEVALPEGLYLADVGFGGLTLTAPLRMVGDVAQQTPHETLRLVAEVEGGARGFGLEIRLGGAWRQVYGFDFAQQRSSDYEVFNWYVSTHPTSRFVQGLIAARPTANGRVALNDRELSRYRHDGSVERRTLDTPSALRRVLAMDFGVELDGLPELDAALARLWSKDGTA